MSLFVEPMPAAARRKLVARRCRESAGWRLIHALGSLQLALLLLATIAIACAVATFAESGFSAKVAQTYIYKAPWFILWLGVLCVNLFAVTLTRWPWERKHAGFIVTHYGIIVLLAGAMIGLQTGFEGNVTLRKDAPPVTRVTTNRSIIQVESPRDSAQYIMPFDAELARLSPERPRVFEVPGTELRIVATEFAPSLVRKPGLAPSEKGAPGVVVEMAGSMAPAPARFVLSQAEGGPAEQDFFGLATLRLADKVTEPPRAAEARMVFANYQAVSDPGAARVPVEVRLSSDGSRVSFLRPDGSGAAYRVSEILRRPVAEAGAIIVVEEYWPDFEIRDGRPATASDQPRNPAALVRLSPATPAARQKPVLELTARDGGVDYALLRDGLPVARGRALPGESIATGWADWQARIVAVEERALPMEQTVAEPSPDPRVLPVPGFLARLEGPGGAKGPDRWVESGRVTSLTDGRNVVRIGYGLETRPLPFSIRLVNFEVPRD
ncbi:MAG: hypothetical protein N2322_05665, partial [Terrimicrobiaceae bacterium]|nr:hypothetical protein [Terrimicrobiaceae bacterium]